MSLIDLRRPLLVATVLAVGPLLWFNADAIFTRQHLVDANCEGCHLAREDIGPGNAHQLLSTQEALCSECHEDAIRVSHPSGISVSRSLPEQYPLDWKNDLTCSTCHQVHGDAPGLLRTDARGPELCLQCHEDRFFDRMRDGGQSLIVSGHIDAGGPVEFDPDLDRFSQQCLQCHAGEFTSDSFRLNRTILRHGDNRMNHPIGSSYTHYEDYGGYVKMSRLKPEIILPEGRLACVSCHRGYSGNHGELVAARGRICYECHDL